MINKKTRIKIWNKYGKRCAYCGELLEYKNMQVDHVIPKRNYSENYGCLINKGKKINYDLNDFRNLNPACRVCNKWKTAMSLDDFKAELQDQVNRLKLRSSNFRIALKYNLIELKEEEIIFYFEKFNK